MEFNMKTCVVIPAYNEAKTIGDIIEKVKSRGLDVIVIDDGSSDDTGKIAARKGAILLSHEKNLGKGLSLRGGFDFVLDNTNYDSVIIIDGDGQHSVDDIDKFLEKSAQENDDIIIGNRMGSTKNMPRIRLLTNKFMSALLSAMCGQNIPDTQCGFRLLTRRVLQTVKFTSSKYDAESEMLITASRKGFKIASVPVTTIYRGERSEIHPVKDTIRFIVLLIKHYLKRK